MRRKKNTKIFHISKNAFYLVSCLVCVLNQNKCVFWTPTTQTLLVDELKFLMDMLLIFQKKSFSKKIQAPSHEIRVPEKTFKKHHDFPNRTKSLKVLSYFYFWRYGILLVIFGLPASRGTFCIHLNTPEKIIRPSTKQLN